MEASGGSNVVVGEYAGSNMWRGTAIGHQVNTSMPRSLIVCLDNNQEVGRLIFDKETGLRFEGDMDETAKVFIERVNHLLGK